MRDEPTNLRVAAPDDRGMFIGAEYAEEIADNFAVLKRKTEDPFRIGPRCG